MSNIKELTEKVNNLSSMVYETAEKVDKILVALTGEPNGPLGISGRIDVLESQQRNSCDRLEKVEKNEEDKIKKTNNILLKIIITIATTSGISSGATAIILKLLN